MLAVLRTSAPFRDRYRSVPCPVVHAVSPIAATADSAAPVTLPERCANSVRAFRYGGQEERQSGESEGTRMAVVASRPPQDRSGGRRDKILRCAAQPFGATYPCPYMTILVSDGSAIDKRGEAR